NTRSTCAGTGTARPAPSVTVSARPARGASSVAGSPIINARRSRLMVPPSLTSSLRQCRCREPMLGENPLAIHRQDKHGEPIGRWRGAVEHRQPIVCTDRKLVSQRDDLLAGILLLRLPCV